MGASPETGRATRRCGRPSRLVHLDRVRQCVVDGGARKVSVVASHPKVVADRFAESLTRAGVEVLAVEAQGIYTAAELGR